MKKQMLLLTLLVSVVTLLNAAQNEVEHIITPQKGLDRKAMHKEKKEDHDVFFSNDEYDECMNVIQKIDPITYNDLKKCEEANAKPCLQKTLTATKEIVEKPTQETHWLPTMTLRFITITNKHYIEKLLLFLDKYKKYTPHYFSKDEYNLYMSHIQKVNPITYNSLKECELETQRPCLQKALSFEEEMLRPPTPETLEYPTLVILPITITNTTDQYVELLFQYLKAYKAYMPITEEERKKVLDIIHIITPELYENLIAIDPSGIHHIQRDYNESTGASTLPSSEDGYPIIFVGSELMNINDKYYAIGHELGHYALGHPEINFYHSKNEISLEKILYHKLELLPKEKNELKNKVSNQIPDKETFANAFNRTQEDEADRFAVVNLKIDCNDKVLATLHKRALEENKDYNNENNRKEKATFKQAHPLWEKRIKNIQELSREAELHSQRTLINWQGLAKRYMEIVNLQKNLSP